MSQDNQNHSFAVLLQKATQGPALASNAPSLATAVSAADALYEHSKVLTNAGLCKTGVAVLVMSAENAQRVLGQGCLWPQDMKDVCWQGGVF